MNNSNFKDSFLVELEKALKENRIPNKYYQIILDFYQCYKSAEKDNTEHEDIFFTFLQLVEAQIKEPFVFQNFHQMIQKPFDYYKFGLDFIKPLVDLSNSNVFGIENLNSMNKELSQGENVILFANHQTEVDPQIISLLLQNDFPKIAKEIIFVAGDRVVTDPLAIPFSMGRNLLCIYSKRYIETPIELKEKKQMHNHKTMQKMAELLKEGGKIIYVAPSGGRDRKDENDKLNVAKFDPQSIELFYLISKKAKVKTNFYPLSLFTYEILPPPKSIQVELGETRVARHSPAQLHFGECIDMEKDDIAQIKNKDERRKSRAEYIWNLVQVNYEKLPKPESL